MRHVHRRGWLPGIGVALAAGVLLVSAGSGVAASTLASWSFPGYTTGNTNYNTNEAVLGSANVGTLSQHSSYLLPSGALQLSNILSVGTTQYLEYNTQDSSGQFFEHVVAINLAKGKARWTSTSAVAPGLASRSTGEPGPIAYHSGAIYASAYDHLDAINATTGAILWSYTPSQMTADLHLEAVANGRVFIRDGDANQNIDAVSTATGARAWTFATDEPIQNAAYGSGTLYVGSGDRYVHAVNATTGAQKWSQQYALDRHTSRSQTRRCTWPLSKT